MRSTNHNTEVSQTFRRSEFKDSLGDAGRASSKTKRPRGLQHAGFQNGAPALHTTQQTSHTNTTRSKRAPAASVRSAPPAANDLQAPFQALGFQAFFSGTTNDCWMVLRLPSNLRHWRAVGQVTDMMKRRLPTAVADTSLRV